MYIKDHLGEKKLFLLLVRLATLEQNPSSLWFFLGVYLFWKALPSIDDFLFFSCPLKPFLTESCSLNLLIFLTLLIWEVFVCLLSNSLYSLMISSKLFPNYCSNLESPSSNCSIWSFRSITSLCFILISKRRVINSLVKLVCAFFNSFWVVVFVLLKYSDYLS